MTQPTPTEAELWMALHDAMDGNLSMLKRRKLIAAYKAAVLDEAADALDAEAATGNLNAPEYGSHENVLDASALLRRMAEEAPS